jgi:hypothetical protein
MSQRKPTAPVKRRVWRISESAPLGEYVEPDTAAPAPVAPKDQPEVSTGGWILSSFDLLQGTEVNENPDTVPDDLFDQLFGGQARPEDEPKPK